MLKCKRNENIAILIR